MISSVKTFLGGVCLAALAIAPVGITAGAFAVAGADAAWAGNGNGGGNGGDNGNGNGGGNGGDNGNGNGNGGGNGNGNGNGNGGGNGGGNGNGGANRGANGPAELLNNLFNGNRGGNAQRGSNSQRQQASAPAKAEGMHPRDRGNMNGALNANINAVLAHIRNGNTNGPVGHLAALAVAEVNADAAQEFLNTPEVIEYFEELDTLEGDFATALEDNDFETYADYEAYLEEDEDGDGTPDNDPIDEIDDAKAELDTFTEENQQMADDIEQAEADLEALDGAEQAILDAWNKNGDSDPETLTEEEQALLDELYGRLDGHEDEILEAMDADG